MKKFISIILAMILAFSGVIVAFAADNKCVVCGKEFTEKEYGSADLAEKAYNAHLESGCKFPCRFGCGAEFSSAANCDAHEKICPEYDGGKCNDCGAEFKTYGDALSHKCEDKSEDTDDTADKAIEFINGIDWEKISDSLILILSKINVKELMEKVMPLVEKLLAIFKNTAGELQQ